MRGIKSPLSMIGGIVGSTELERFSRGGVGGADGAGSMLEGKIGDGGSKERSSSAMSASIPADIEALPEPLILSLWTGLASDVVVAMVCG